MKARYLWLVVLVLLALSVAACGVRQKGRKPSNDWSRGVPVGVFVRGDIDMEVSPAGDQSHLVFLVDDEGTLGVQYVLLDATAVALTEQILDIPGQQIRSPRIALAKDGFLHFLWSTRSNGEPGWDLWYAQLSSDGELHGRTQLADIDQDVGDSELKADSLGNAYVVWENGAENSIMGLQLDVDGKTTAVPTQLVAAGDTPSLYIDVQDDAHFIWRDDIVTRYTHWPHADWSATEGEAIVNVPLSTGQTLAGPVVGAAGEWVTIVWSTFSSSGLEAGSAVTEYVAFPIVSPQRSTPERLLISAAEDQVFEPYDGAYQLTELSPPSSILGSTNFVQQPSIASAQENELAVGFSVGQDFRLDTFIQVGVAIFEDGEFIGYQPAGKTEAFSQRPALASDAEGNLYIAWREGGQGTLAFFALTAPEGREKLDQFVANDVTSVAINGGIEAIAGALFFPLACIWLFPGFLIIGLWHVYYGDSEFRRKGTVVVLVIAIVVSQVMKFLFLPTITTYIPFSAWVDIGAQWQQPLSFIVPIFTAAAGLLFAWYMHRRTHSALAFFFWFTATDAILTLAIYGVNLMGVF